MEDAIKTEPTPEPVKLSLSNITQAVQRAHMEGLIDGVYMVVTIVLCGVLVAFAIRSIWMADHA